VPAWTGLIIRDHRNAAAAERLRAEQTALLAEMDRVQAVGAERARMARELHDLIANHLSAIAIHSTAALSLDPPDETATRESLGVIRENSVQGLAEMRRLIGLLRDASDGDAAQPAASPTLAGLDALLERARAGAGNPGLSFSLRDERGAGGTSLPAPVELAAYRVVQESLTNALKHSAPGEVTVELARDRAPGPLTVRVTSPLHGGSGPGESGRPSETTGAGPRAPGSGTGLIGMRERVELLGGKLHVGPAAGTYGADGTDDSAEAGGRPPKSWVVRAELPVEEGSPG
jgi:signal transduction histidine kinase